MYWLLSKIGSLFTIAGIISIIFLSAAEEYNVNTVCAVIGCICGVGGILMGRKIYLHGTSPVILFFSSARMITDNIVFSCIVWFFRMFFVPFIIACLYFIVTAGN